jgi:hypothetical protein
MGLFNFLLLMLAAAPANNTQVLPKECISSDFAKEEECYEKHEMKLTARKNASLRTKNRLREHSKFKLSGTRPPITSNSILGMQHKQCIALRWPCDTIAALEEEVY